MITVKDVYNPVKTWLIKRTACGHYYYSQAIHGKRLYPFSRTTKKFLQAAQLL